VAESKTAGFTITSGAKSSSTPKPQTTQNSISLFSWLLVATALFTFTSLTVFLRRKPYSQTGPTTELSTFPTAAAPALIDASQLAVPSAAEEILSQQGGLQPFAAKLSNIKSIAQRIDALQKALNMERENLAKEMADVNKTVQEQEKAIKHYFDAVRGETEKYSGYLSDQEKGKTENNENQTNKSENEN
jgi:hypothetical protein